MIKVATVQRVTHSKGMSITGLECPGNMPNVSLWVIYTQSVVKTGVAIKCHQLLKQRQKPITTTTWVFI